MKTLVTKGIVLSRLNFGEADRIITVLTSDQGKLRLMAKGVRRIKSKMAGGIELFSVNDITYLLGKGEFGTLISSRLEINFGEITKDINRTMFAYDVLKKINKVTEESAENEYFHLLKNVLASLSHGVELPIIEAWFYAQLLDLSGHSPNLQTDETGKKLEADKLYNFSFDSMSFNPHTAGNFNSGHIKFLRLALDANSPKALARITGATELAANLTPLLKGVTKDTLNL